MTIEIKMLTLGMVQTNAYLIGDTESGQAILIDPVADAETLYETAQSAGWSIDLILATHAHFDHVLASKAIKEMTAAPFYIHEDAVKWLKMLPQSGKMFGLGEFPEAAEPDRLLTTATETIELGAIKLETLYTPGHADGHLSFYMRDHDVVFSGDTLFKGSIGRTDLPGGDPARLMRSIVEQIIPLGDETQVLSGHGDPTTVGRERKVNPFLRSYDSEA